MISVAASVNRLVKPRNQTGRGIRRCGSEDDTAWLRALGCKGEPRFLRRGSRDQACNVLADSGSVFEAMTRASTDEPDALVLGMAIDEEVAGVGVLVGTDARLDHRRVGHRRK